MTSCWTIIGTTKWSGTYRGKQAVLTELLQPLGNSLRLNTPTRVSLYAEHDYVVVECRGDVITKSGMRYNNTYCWVCRFGDGKLLDLTEYSDTELIAAALKK